MVRKIDLGKCFAVLNNLETGENVEVRYRTVKSTQKSVAERTMALVENKEMYAVVESYSHGEDTQPEQYRIYGDGEIHVLITSDGFTTEKVGEVLSVFPVE